MKRPILYGGADCNMIVNIAYDAFYHKTNEFFRNRIAEILISTAWF